MKLLSFLKNVNFKNLELKRYLKKRLFSRRDSFSLTVKASDFGGF